MPSTSSSEPLADAIPTRPFIYSDGVLTIDGLPLSLLAAEFGTPLYVYSAANIRHRLSLFEQAFAPTPHTVCYAVKALSSLAILELLGRLGAGFDIVSGGELERVRRACPDALSRVVFSGVGKQIWEIDAALHAGILLFNVESAEELDILAARAAALGKHARVALRVNPDVFAETHPYISTGLREHKFGIDIALARGLYRHAATLPSLIATGVSVHIGSQIEDVHPFAEALTRVAALVEELRADGHTITHIDLGGGLGIDYLAPLDPSSSHLVLIAALSREETVTWTGTQSSPATVILTEAKRRGETPVSRSSSTTPPSSTQPESQTTGEPHLEEASPDTLTPDQQVTSYAAALLPTLRTLNCHLLLEPGRFLVAQSGALLTRVLGTKRNGSKRFVITDAAMNDLIRPALYQAHHEIVPVTPPQQGSEAPAAASASIAPGHRATDVVDQVTRVVGSATDVVARATSVVNRATDILDRPTDVVDRATSVVDRAYDVVDIVGPVCESGDFFAHDRPLPPLAAGDLVALLDAGAYGMSQASNYNTRPRPAELLIDAGQAHLIRRRETLDDLLAQENLL